MGESEKVNPTENRTDTASDNGVQALGIILLRKPKVVTSG